MNYYDEIKNKLIENEIYNQVKDFSKERNKVMTYFEIGKLLSEAGKEYGKNVIKQYSEKLVIEVGKKYNERTLRRIRQFYEVFSNEKWSTVWTKLSWSHYREVLSLNDINAIKYYINISEQQNLSIRQLRERIKSKEYERLPENAKLSVISKENTTVTSFIKNPIYIKNNFDYEVISEKILQKLILEDIESFMKELGDSFSFIASEYKIKLGDKYNYVDLLLYNIKYKCYVVIELKITELKKEHIGQIQTYMNYIDRNVKTLDENKTIGIIIVKKDDKYIMEYCSDERIIAREYELVG